MCDPRSCSNMTCPSNPCAVCTIDPCSCRVTFVDLLTRKPVDDCDIGKLYIQVELIPYKLDNNNVMILIKCFLLNVLLFD